jgi:hypothetical protein
VIPRVHASKTRQHLAIFGFALIIAIFAILLTATAALGVAPRTSHVELYHPGDFVSQTNTVQCVGASMQMMLNMIQPGQDRTARTQLALQHLARASGPPPIWAGGREFTRPRRGASSFGWAAGLSRRGGGPYQVEAALTRRGALRRAAEAMQATGRPVGLLVWHGAHAWVMSGFRATRRPNGEIGRISSITILDPWYPRYSGTHGSSPRPGTRLTPRQLAADYLPWHRWFRSPFDGRYVLVLPYDPEPEPQLTQRTATPSLDADWSLLPAPRLKPRPI